MRSIWVNTIPDHHTRIQHWSKNSMRLVVGTCPIEPIVPTVRYYVLGVTYTPHLVLKKSLGGTSTSRRELHQCPVLHYHQHAQRPLTPFDHQSMSCANLRRWRWIQFRYPVRLMYSLPRLPRLHRPLRPRPRLHKQLINQRSIPSGHRHLISPNSTVLVVNQPRNCHRHQQLSHHPVYAPPYHTLDSQKTYLAPVPV